MSVPEPSNRKSPWSFVPTLYVLQGMNSFVVQTAANTYFAVLQLPLESIGKYTSDLTLPFTLKPLWSPLVDLIGTKRSWLIGSGVATAVAIVWLAFAMQHPDPVRDVVLACTAVALAGATNDIATDGYYMLALEKQQQEFFVGVRSSAFRLGWVAVAGGAVWLAGDRIERAGGQSVPLAVKQGAFSTAFLLAGILYALLTLWHVVTLPRPGGDAPARGSQGGFAAARAALAEYFARPGIVAVMAFVFLYRAAETMLTPMIQPFLLGSRESGGLGVSTEDVGVLNGTLGVLALLAGGILGGVLVSRAGLRTALWPLALAMHVPNVLFAWAAHAQFGLVGVGAVVCVEKFGYGLGLSAYMAALLAFSRGSRYATTHYALSTGLMASSAWLAGRYSGTLAERLGYEQFFWGVCALGLVGLATLPFFPHAATEARAQLGAR